MYLNTPLQTYLDDLASAQSTPGGGSAAALSGAMGAGLVCMVARLTLSKAEYATVHQEVETIVQAVEQLRTRFQQLLQEDIDAYGRLSACFKMPRGTDEERTVRTNAIQERLVEAALVPLEIAECAAAVVRYSHRIAEIGNVNVLSDIGVAVMLAASAATAAAWMVRVNLKSLKDVELVEAMGQRLGMALDSITEIGQQVIGLVREKA
jgi:formiminotetrahydrofolate cyclodeaminase